MDVVVLKASQIIHGLISRESTVGVEPQLKSRRRETTAQTGDEIELIVEINAADFYFYHTESLIELLGNAFVH